MTFEQWWLEFISEHPEWQYADSSALRKAAFNAGAASRDAEVAELVAALEHYAEQDERNARHYPPEFAKEALAKVRKPT